MLTEILTRIDNVRSQISARLVDRSNMLGANKLLNVRQNYVTKPLQKYTHALHTGDAVALLVGHQACDS